DDVIEGSWIPPGTYTGLLETEDGDVRRIRHPIEVRPGERLVVEAPPQGDVVEVFLSQGGRPVSSDSLGLTSLDIDPHDSVSGDMIALMESGLLGRHLATAPPGRYGLFLRDTWLGEVALPAVGPIRVDLPVVGTARL